MSFSIFDAILFIHAKSTKTPISLPLGMITTRGMSYEFAPLASDFGITEKSLQVRSEFDALLLDHASVCGAKVFHPYKATSIAFSSTSSASSPLGRPTSVTWLHTSCAPTNQCTGIMSFDYLIDASGRAGIMSTKYLKNRRFNANLKNIAMWGYWTGVGTYAQETAAEGAPWFEALTGMFCFASSVYIS